MLLGWALIHRDLIIHFAHLKNDQQRRNPAILCRVKEQSFLIKVHIEADSATPIVHTGLYIQRSPSQLPFRRKPHCWREYFHWKPMGFD